MMNTEQKLAEDQVPDQKLKKFMLENFLLFLGQKETVPNSTPSLRPVR